MAQGKAWDKQKAIEVLKPYFQLGCSVTKACKYAGIAQSTVQTWIDNDEHLRLEITAWQNEISAKARANWRAKIASGEYQPSLQWLEKQEKDEFANRTELTGADGVQLTTSLTPEEQARIDKATEMAAKAYEEARKLNP